jgi:hypothetical protein
MLEHTRLGYYHSKAFHPVCVSPIMTHNNWSSPNKWTKDDSQSWQSSHSDSKQSWHPTPDKKKSWTASPSWNDTQSRSSPWNDSTSWKSPTFSSASFTQGAQIPKEFQQTDEFLDERMVKGVQLKRHIESTAWSRKHGLAGKPLEQVVLADLAYRGWQEQSLRYLSNGRFTNILFTKSVSESVFVTSLLQGLRESAIDLDKLAENLHKQDGHRVPSKHEEAQQFMAPLVAHIVDGLSQLDQMFTPLHQHPKIIELEEKLNKARASGFQVSPEPERTSPGKRKASPTLPVKSQRNIKDAFKQASANSGKPLVKIDDEEPSPSKSPINEPAPDIFQPLPTFRPLETNPPTDGTTKAVAKWLAAIRKELPRTKENKLREHLKEVKKTFDEATSAPSFPDLAAKYGLPVKIAAEASNDDIITMIGAVTFAAA